MSIDYNYQYALNQQIFMGNKAMKFNVVINNNRFLYEKIMSYLFTIINALNNSMDITYKTSDFMIKNIDFNIDKGLNLPLNEFPQNSDWNDIALGFLIGGSAYHLYSNYFQKCGSQYSMYNTAPISHDFDTAFAYKKKSFKDKKRWKTLLISKIIKFLNVYYDSNPEFSNHLNNDLATVNDISAYDDMAKNNNETPIYLFKNKLIISIKETNRYDNIRISGAILDNGNMIFDHLYELSFWTLKKSILSRRFNVELIKYIFVYSDSRSGLPIPMINPKNLVLSNFGSLRQRSLMNIPKCYQDNLRINFMVNGFKDIFSRLTDPQFKDYLQNDVFILYDKITYQIANVMPYRICSLIGLYGTENELNGLIKTLNKFSIKGSLEDISMLLKEGYLVNKRGNFNNFVIVNDSDKQTLSSFAQKVYNYDVTLPTANNVTLLTNNAQQNSNTFSSTYTNNNNKAVTVTDPKIIARLDKIEKETDYIRSKLNKLKLNVRIISQGLIQIFTTMGRRQ